MLILAPTRELAQQSQDVLGKSNSKFRISPLDGHRFLILLGIALCDDHTRLRNVIGCKVLLLSLE